MASHSLRTVKERRPGPWPGGGGALDARRTLTALSLLLACSSPHGQEERTNVFEDPFLRVTQRLVACPVPEGPLYTQARHARRYLRREGNDAPGSLPPAQRLPYERRSFRASPSSSSATALRRVEHLDPRPAPLGLPQGMRRERNAEPRARGRGPPDRRCRGRDQRADGGHVRQAAVRRAAQVVKDPAVAALAACAL
jgi:hypothetical protein